MNVFVDRLFKFQAIGLLNYIDITQKTQNFIFHSGCLNNLCLVSIYGDSPNYKHLT